MLSDETTVLARAVSGGSNIVRLGEAQARLSLRTGLEQVTGTARISPKQIHAACIGVAGAARAEVVAKLHAIFAHLSLTNVEIVGDTVIALEAAFGSGPGVIAISGTGSIVYGRDEAGRVQRAGGWGFAISDEGSGHWIGRKAISAILQAHDEGRQNSLSAYVLKTWNLHSLDELVQYANATPPPEFPRIFPVVLRAADEGDAEADKLLVEAGQKLAMLVVAVMRKFERHSATEPKSEERAPVALPVATTGSVFRQAARVRESFKACLAEKVPGIAIREQIVQPIEGALARARASQRTNQDPA